MIRKALVIILTSAAVSCSGTKNTAYEPVFEQGRPVVVYKTKRDYHNNVPVFLSADKSRVIGYPHPSDLKGENGELLLPAKLKKGYWLDNKGIDTRVAFISLTYKEYSKLKEAPSIDSLRKLVIDDDPLVEVCNCGSRDYLNEPKKQLNGLIRSGELEKKCRKIK